MIMKKSIVILLILLLPSVCFGGWNDRQGNPLPDEPHMKSTGTFGAQLVLTDKEALMLERWNTPSETVYFSSTDTIKINEPITAFIIFSGCGADENGNCNLIGKYKIYQPDGSVYADLPFQEIWVNKPVPPNRNLALGVGYIKIVIEPHEQLGEYVVEMEVVDNNLKKKLLLETNFTATK